jgi:Protein kinase domain
VREKRDSRPAVGDGAAFTRLLSGRYELGPVLGRGGMATVRQGTDLRLGRTVAVKTLHGELSGTPAFQARFRREARAAAALHHPAIVSVYDAGEDTLDDALTCYIVMEYVDGDTARELLRSGPLDPGRALEITAEVLDALAESHRCGIVHRDIKPANVMLTREGAVKVMDFGVARAVADVSASLTQTATVIGTAHYLSPEQARGEVVDARSDVYSTGCLLYELLTGRPPFVGDSAVAVAYQHVREAPQPPSAFAPALPPGVDAVVLAALAKQPGERYQSAAQMRGDLQAVLAGGQLDDGTAPAGLSAAAAGGGIPARDDDETTSELQPVADTAAGATTTLPPSPAAGGVAAGGSPWRRRRVRVLVAAVAVVLVAGLGGFALSRLGEEPVPRQDAERVPAGGPSPDDRTAPAGGSADAPDGASGAVRPAGGGLPDADGDGGGAGAEDGAGTRRQQTGAEPGDTPVQLSRRAGEQGTPTASPTPQPSTTEDPTREPTTSEPTPSESPTPEPTPSESPTPEPTPSPDPGSTSTPQSNQETSLGAASGGPA